MVLHIKNNCLFISQVFEVHSNVCMFYGVIYYDFTLYFFYFFNYFSPHCCLSMKYLKVIHVLSHCTFLPLITLFTTQLSYIFNTNRVLFKTFFKCFQNSLALFRYPYNAFYNSTYNNLSPFVGVCTKARYVFSFTSNSISTIFCLITIYSLFVISVLRYTPIISHGVMLLSSTVLIKHDKNRNFVATVGDVVSSGDKVNLCFIASANALPLISHSSFL